MSRSRRIVLMVSVVATLALLCCGGSVTAIVFGGFFDEKPKELVPVGFNCGEKGPIDPNAKLPSIRSYGAAQVRNAAVIINTGKEKGLPPRAWVIAVATAMQESGLNNLGNLGARNDHDSLGLFQQRPSSGWGSPTQVRNPEYAATKFYDKLKKVRGWERMALTRAAQKVQISAYPDAYAKHEMAATQIVNKLADGAANAVGDSVQAKCATAGKIAASGWTDPLKAKAGRSGPAFSVGSGFRTRDRPTHQGVDLIAGRNTPIIATASGVVSKVKCDQDHTGRQTCNVDGFPGKGGCGWMVEIQHAGNVMTRYCHLVRKPDVVEGQKVTAGETIGLVGTSGNSSGPHLHFEVHLDNDRSSAGAVNPVPFMRNQGSPLGDEG